MEPFFCRVNRNTSWNYHSMMTPLRNARDRSAPQLVCSMMAAMGTKARRTPWNRCVSALSINAER